MPLTKRFTQLNCEYSAALKTLNFPEYHDQQQEEMLARVYVCVRAIKFHDMNQ
jgi:hypothetical protein